MGIAFGFSQFIQFAVFALIHYAGAEFLYHFGTPGEDVFISMSALMNGAFAAGQAQ